MNIRRAEHSGAVHVSYSKSEGALASVARLGGFEFDCAVNIGLGGWTKFGLVFGQFGGFQNI